VSAWAAAQQHITANPQGAADGVGGGTGGGGSGGDGAAPLSAALKTFPVIRLMGCSGGGDCGD